MRWLGDLLIATAEVAAVAAAAVGAIAPTVTAAAVALVVVVDDEWLTWVASMAWSNLRDDEGNDEDVIKIHCSVWFQCVFFGVEKSE